MPALDRTLAPSLTASQNLIEVDAPHERVMPLLDGRVKIEGVEDLTYTISDPSPAAELNSNRFSGEMEAGIIQRTLVPGN